MGNTMFRVASDSGVISTRQPIYFIAILTERVIYTVINGP